jgi:hypothetical protein
VISKSKFNSYPSDKTYIRFFKKHYKSRIIRYIILTLIIISFNACDKGIEPKNYDEPTGFSGTVTFVGEWPAQIKRTFIVVFKDPLLSAADFTITNLKFLSLEILLGVQTYNFSSLDSSYIPQNPGPFLTGEYAYVAVAYQTTDQLSLARKDWYVAGVYDGNLNTNEPATMIVRENIFITYINIACDFNNPPPQPPGGS